MQPSKAKKGTKKGTKKTTKKAQKSFGMALDLDDQELTSAPPPSSAIQEDDDEFIVYKGKSNIKSNQSTIKQEELEPIQVPSRHQVQAQPQSHLEQQRKPEIIPEPQPEPQIAPEPEKQPQIQVQIQQQPKQQMEVPKAQQKLPEEQVEVELKPNVYVFKEEETQIKEESSSPVIEEEKNQNPLVMEPQTLVEERQVEQTRQEEVLPPVMPQKEQQTSREEIHQVEQKEKVKEEEPKPEQKKIKTKSKVMGTGKEKSKKTKAKTSTKAMFEAEMDWEEGQVKIAEPIQDKVIHVSQPIQQFKKEQPQIEEKHQSSPMESPKINIQPQPPIVNEIPQQPIPRVEEAQIIKQQEKVEPIKEEVNIEDQLEQMNFKVERLKNEMKVVKKGKTGKGKKPATKIVSKLKAEDELDAVLQSTEVKIELPQPPKQPEVIEKPEDAKTEEPFQNLNQIQQQVKQELQLKEEPIVQIKKEEPNEISKPVHEEPSHSIYPQPDSKMEQKIEQQPKHENKEKSELEVLKITSNTLSKKKGKKPTTKKLNLGVKSKLEELQNDFEESQVKEQSIVEQKQVENKFENFQTQYEIKKQQKEIEKEPQVVPIKTQIENRPEKQEKGSEESLQVLKAQLKQETKELQSHEGTKVSAPQPLQSIQASDSSERFEDFVQKRVEEIIEPAPQVETKIVEEQILEIDSKPSFSTKSKPTKGKTKAKQPKKVKKGKETLISLNNDLEQSLVDKPEPQNQIKQAKAQPQKEIVLKVKEQIKAFEPQIEKKIQQIKIEEPKERGKDPQPKPIFKLDYHEKPVIQNEVSQPIRKKLVDELVSIVKQTNKKNLNAMKERFLMMQEDIRSSLVERQAKEKAKEIPEVHYDHIIAENIELKHHLSGEGKNGY